MHYPVAGVLKQQDSGDIMEALCMSWGDRYYPDETYYNGMRAPYHVYQQQVNWHYKVPPTFLFQTCLL